MSKQPVMIDAQYLKDHPKDIFVFGDNLLRKGTGGAAALRYNPNTYGFITKKAPSLDDSAYFTPKEYLFVFLKELKQLRLNIELNPDKTVLISKLGSGLANKYHIWEEVISPRISELKAYKNVKFLF